MRKPPLPRLVVCLSLTLGWFATGCDSGSSGNQGAGGKTGTAGTTGTAGATATGGTTGTAGTTGSTGTGGTTATGGSTETPATGGVTGTGGSTGTVGGSGGMSGATGTAGTTATGGATGTAGAMGTAGASGGVKSDGCNMEPGQALMSFVKYTIMVGTAPRDYYVRLPANYDKAHTYPTVFVGPGCGGNGASTIPIEKASGETAIVIGLQQSAKVTGRDCFMTESAMSPEIPYFDATVAAVEAKFCIDKSHLYMEGFSSGSWLANLLGCARGNILKAQGNASGCTPPIPTCTGPIPYMAVHDSGDGNNSYMCGTQNRDRILKLNGCAMTNKPYEPGPMVVAPAGKTISCVQYDCPAKYPAVFCTTTGLGHNDGSITGASTYGFWKFWSALP
jgi:polyhydroxybutyrate depolymerase